MPLRCPSGRAFTLTELLVVIGIITVLIAILLPSLSAVRRNARATQCNATLYDLGLAMAMYLNENRQTYPQPAQNTKIAVNGRNDTAVAKRAQGGCVWFNALDAYLSRNLKNYSSGSADDDRRNYTPAKEDPVWPGFGETVDTPNEDRQRTIKMNSYFGNPILVKGVDVPRWAKTRHVRRASDTVLLFDGVARDAAAALPTSSSPALDFSGKWSNVGLRHGRGKSANVLFADGHATNVTQAFHRYAPTSKTAYDIWEPEFTDESVQYDPAASATRNPAQGLVWDFWRE